MRAGVLVGQNDLCMSMGLYEKYAFPLMYESPELGAATEKMLRCCARHAIIPGIFLFGPAKVPAFRAKGFTFVSVGNDLHHVLAQSNSYISQLKEESKGDWAPLPSGIVTA